MKKVALAVVLAASILVWLFLARQKDDHTLRSDADPSIALPSNTLVHRLVDKKTTAIVHESKSPFAQKSEELEKQARVSFETLLRVLQPYGVVDNGREAYFQNRTNRQGGVNIEVGIRAGNHRASFGAGPVNTNGLHTNPFLPDGALLRLFESMVDGSDTRRNPDGVKTWYRSTAQWSEEEAVTETMRLLAGLGVPRERIVKHKFSASPMTVKNPAGEPVRVTPFYRVDVYDKQDSPDDDPGFIIIEFRMDEKPPGKVTRLSVWPPIKVP